MLLGAIFFHGLGIRTLKISFLGQINNASYQSLRVLPIVLDCMKKGTKK
jgi:hypothetical protein